MKLFLFRSLLLLYLSLVLITKILFRTYSRMFKYTTHLNILHCFLLNRLKIIFFIQKIKLFFYIRQCLVIILHVSVIDQFILQILKEVRVYICHCVALYIKRYIIILFFRITFLNLILDLLIHILLTAICTFNNWIFFI